MKFVLFFLGAFCLTSCASYVNPGKPADLGVFTDPDLKKAYSAKPAMKFPANIAIVRVQEPGYQSETARGAGSGAYSVVTTRDIETEADGKRIADLPGVGDVVALNRLLLPKALSSDLDLRSAAAKLQADAVLVYTVATEFDSKDVLEPLSALTLGVIKNSRHHVTSSVSAILMDARTGFVYGALEDSDQRAGVAVLSGGDAAREASRKKSERAAFDKMLSSFEPFWNSIHARYK